MNANNVCTVYILNVRNFVSEDVEANLWNWHNEFICDESGHNDVEDV